MKHPRLALVALAVLAVPLADRPASGQAHVPRPATQPATKPAGIGKPDQEMDGRFGGLLAFTTDHRFFDDWAKPEAPHLSPARQVHRGETIYTVLLLGGPTAGPDGNADVTYDFTMTKPDGSDYGSDTGAAALSGKVPSPKEFIISESFPIMDVEADDPLGTYAMTLTLHDKVSGKHVTLRQAFTVVEGKPDPKDAAPQTRPAK